MVVLYAFKMLLHRKTSAFRNLEVPMFYNCENITDLWLSFFFFCLVVHTRSLVIPVGTKLEFCTAQGNKYQLGQAFTFTDKCFLFNCECYQDGSWECPSEKSQYTCPLNPGKKSFVVRTEMCIPVNFFWSFCFRKT